MPEDKLPPLPGTAPDGTWRIATIDRDESDGRLAICAIVARSSSAPLSLIGAGEGTLIGTGFYIVPNGGFATAKHVALEAQEAMSRAENSVGLVYTLTNGLLVFRPIWSFAVHPTADLAFGVPHEIIDNETRKAYRARVLSLERAHLQLERQSVRGHTPFTASSVSQTELKYCKRNRTSITAYCRKSILDAALQANCKRPTI